MFIKKALDSVLNQTIERNLFEIILITNITPEWLQSYASVNEVRLIHTDATSLEDKLLEGVRLSKGEVLCFLEDDDVFLPNKLFTVYRAMKETRISYYHNKHVDIDYKGTKNKNSFDSPWFNLSCISIKKKVLNMDLLSREKFPEKFMYLSAIDSGDKIIKSGTVLTKYMRHESASNIVYKSFEEFMSKRLRGYARMEEEEKIFMEFFKGRDASKIIACFRTDKMIENYCLTLNDRPRNLINFIINKHSFKRRNLKKVLKYFSVRLFPQRMNKYFIKKLRKDFIRYTSTTIRNEA